MAVMANEKTAGSVHKPGSELSAHPDADERDPSSGDQTITCPSHTTDKRLMLKIDLHVIPFLCVMYTLAFLG